MFDLLRFVESQKNVDRVMAWCGYGTCVLCAVMTVVICIAIIIEHG
ncbi:hypothetical protein SAMN05216466_103536 [Paraburkholderia phenazinium]|jgi:hypothetical protein|uniref:Uncharacterized protein n=1 Tax=Paraburkholderia phenazinium TaxID=60549 RepID=A0A1G7UNM2_9BURK|nr:hypothetical protein SAMN05216466_103536 [Paraburkholderia phenazinium]